ncbi:MAG: M28 family peptidase [Bacteroidia bacterium]|nr:M28 family peptidase [Bacteroidia bacterium]
MRSVSEAPKRSGVRNAPTLASARGTPKKMKLSLKPNVLFLCMRILIVASILSVCCAQAQINSENVQKHIAYLASDKLQGRGTGEKGEELAAEYIIKHFKNLKLIPKGQNNTYIQEFNFVEGIIQEPTIIRINKNKKITWQDKKDYCALPFSASNEYNLRTLHFEYVNEGIVAPTLQRDDYANKNVMGKVVVIYSFPEKPLNPHEEITAYYSFRERAKIAQEKGAVMVFFVDRKGTYHFEDLPKTNSKAQFLRIPVVWFSHSTFEELRQLNITDFYLKISIKPNEMKGKNVIGFLDNQAPLTVVIGAHYDHLGLGHHPGSLDPNPKNKIHNGADDNASGTAGLLELARYFATNNRKENFNFLFIAFSGEELGLYGSGYFTKNPTLDLNTVNYMLNMDMIGRLREQQLAISGVGTSPVWVDLIKQIDSTDTHITTKLDSSGTGPSDHTSFYLRNIPVLHFFTGTHADYHKPTDDIDKINFEGIVQVLNFIINLTEKTEKLSKLTFTPTKEKKNENPPAFKVTLGIIPDYMYGGKGIKVEGVSAGKPAERAGIQRDDILLQINNDEIIDMMSYMKCLAKYKKGDTVKIKIERNKQIIEKEVTF